MQGHIRSILPQKGGVAPVDSDTLVLFPFSEHTNDSVRGVHAIGKERALGVKNSYVMLNEEAIFELPSYGEFTIQAWVYIREYSNFCVFGKGSASFDFRIETNGTRFNLVKYAVIDQYVTVPTPVPLAKWTHVAAIQHLNRVDYYIDGKKVGSYSHSGAYKTSSGPAYIGTNQARAQRLDGFISDVKVWSRAITEIENISSMESSLSQQNGLVGWWPMDEGEGNVIRDASPFGNDGTIGDPEWGAGPLVYSSFLNREGVLLEEGTTNLIKAGVFTAIGGASVVKRGDYEYTITTASAAISGINFPDAVVQNGITKTFSCKVQGEKGVKILIQVHSLFKEILLTGEKQDVTFTVSENTTNRSMGVFTGYGASPVVATTFELFDVQLEEKGFPTSFTEGVRAPSNLTYPPIVHGMKNFTVSMWVKVLAFGKPYQTILSIDNGNNANGLWVDCFPGVWFRCFAYPTDGAAATVLTSTSITPLNTWKFLSASYDGTSLNFYVDGQWVSQSKVSFEATGNVMLGKRLSIKENNADSLVVDQFRVDKIARTSEEIKAWYHQGRGER